MRRLDWWLEWPSGLVRTGVVLLTCAVFAAVVVTYPSVLRELGDDASRNSALSYTDREIAGGNELVPDQGAAYAARALIPKDESYDVAVDPGFDGGSELTVPFVESYYRYFLLPRRPSEDAKWVICYGCDLREDGSRFEVVWDGGEGVSILRARP